MLCEDLGLYGKPHDKLHLGSNGVYKLVTIIRKCVYGTLFKKTAQSVKPGKLYSTAAKGAPGRYPS